MPKKLSFRRCLVFCSALWLGADPALAFDSTLIDFNLTDQFERNHSHHDYLGKMVIVIASDHEGSKFNAAWGEAIRDSLDDDSRFAHVTFIGVADVRVVPGFLRDFVRRQFPKERNILLDWEGNFAQSYALEPKSTNVIAFGPGGKLLHRVFGTKVTPSLIGPFIESIKRVIDR